MMDPIWIAVISAAIGALVPTLSLLFKGKADAAARHEATVLAAREAAREDRSAEEKATDGIIKRLEAQVDRGEKRIESGEKRLEIAENGLRDVQRLESECREILARVQTSNADCVAELAKFRDGNVPCAEVKELRDHLQSIRAERLPKTPPSVAKE